MPLQEDRIASLERKVAALELRRLYDERKAEESTPSAQVYNLREINENMTILLGIASSQEMSIKKIGNDLSLFQESMEQRFTSVEQRFVSMEQRFTSLEENVDRRFVSIEGTLQQVLLLLNTLTSKPHQET